jgi:hypothetical protein
LLEHSASVNRNALIRRIFFSVRKLQAMPAYPPLVLKLLY